MKNLGQNIKSLRKQKGKTLLQVSKETGIDMATLSRIENGRMTGTIQSHMVIARSLEVHLPDLYEKAFTSDDPSDGKKEKAATGVFSHSGGSVSELLTTHLLQKKMMPVRLKLKGSSATAKEQLPLGTERFVYVLSGKVEVTIKNAPNIISETETLYFNASLPHSFKNKLKTPSSCLILTTPAAL